MCVCVCVCVSGMNRGRCVRPTDWTGVLLGDEMQVEDGWEGPWGDNADCYVSRSSTDILCWMRFVWLP